MNDVAKKAGVSRGTVSNYINHVKIKESSRKKVEAAIRELHYVPNMAARELKTSTASTVVFILPTVWNPFFSELTYYLQLALKERGWRMLLCNSEDDYRAEIEYIEMAHQHKVAGIISISYSDITPYLTEEIPYVAIERFYNDSIPSVTSDNLGGGGLAAQILAEKGAERLLHITRYVPGNHALMSRKEGFEKYCQRHQIPYEVAEAHVSSADFSAYLADFLQAHHKAFDGIFCGTDRYASYCLGAMAKLGLAAPEDIQVIGFDGSKSYVTDELYISTIRQPVAALAREAVQLLAKRFDQQEKVPQIVLPVTFLQRKTTRA